jgi:serine/threonine-protein kinase
MVSEETVTLTRSTTVADAPVAELVIPRQLGSVRLRHEIGRGGMGVVWLGHDELLAREVAVKFLLGATAGPDDPGFTRFIGGARAAAAVRHPGLTTIYHADVVAGVPYLVMEYVDGPSASELRRRCGALPLAAVLAVLDSAADAVGTLHEQGIIHQDIKPGNVLLNADGVALVTDFGLAHARVSLQAPGAGPAAAGTPSYMAPEMLDGHVSPRSDVYAFGIMTYELLCGRLPFVGSLEEVCEQHRRAALPVAGLAAQGVTAALIQVLERAAHKDAIFRYKTARHFLRAVQDACPSAPPPAARQRQLALLVTQCRGPSAAATGSGPGERTPGSYYDTLAARAAAKRRKGPPSFDTDDGT